nr:RHS domain-containing protein [Delftia acidovorans]
MVARWPANYLPSTPPATCWTPCPAKTASLRNQCDQIGAPLELTDEQGQVAWAADYKVWDEAVMRSVLRTGTDDRPVSGLGVQSLLHHLHRRRLSSPSGGYRGSSLVKRQGCTTTDFGITIRWWGDLLVKMLSGYSEDKMYMQIAAVR